MRHTAAATTIGPSADGTCTVIGELLPVGFTRTEPLGVAIARFTYRHDRLVAIERAFGAAPVRHEVLDYDAGDRLVETYETGPDDFQGPAAHHATDVYRYRDTPTGVAIDEVRATGETVTCTVDRHRRELTCAGHGGGGGAWTSLTRYDAQARVIAESIDYATSTTSNSRVVRTYDDAAHSMRETRDFDGDGTTDREDVTTYDAAGRVTANTGHGPTATSNLGHWTSTIAYTLDAAGRVTCATTTGTIDLGAGAGPSTDTRCYTYDPAGNVTSVTRASDHATETTTYDGRFRAMTCGHLARAEQPDDAETTEARQVWDDQIRAMMHD